MRVKDTFQYLSPILFLAFCCGGAIADPASVMQTQETFPWLQSYFVPCANGGAGEYVDFSGTIHHEYTMIVTGTRYQSHYIWNPMGAKGVGRITGDQYNATGKTGESSSGNWFPGLAFERTFVNLGHFVGPGPGNDFFAKGITHVTITPSGEMTSFQYISSVICK